MISSRPARRLPEFIAAGLVAVSLVAAPLTALAASKEKIDRRVAEALVNFKEKVSTAESLMQKAEGVLVFPNVKKAGIGIGGERGSGALLIDGEVADYYRVTAGSIGLQLGAQVKTEIILFMTPEAMTKFRAGDGFEVGADGSVAIATVGAGGEIDSTTARAPIIGFIFSNKGLMYNLTLEGAKISRLDK